MRARARIEWILPERELPLWKKVGIWFLIIVILAGMGVGVYGIVWLVDGALARQERLADVRAELTWVAEREVEKIEAEKARQEAERQRQERIRTSKLVALTFDDGPSAETTGRLLDILRDKNVRATFFVIGNRARNLPWLVQREISEGHVVGSHTMAHMNFNKAKTGAEIANDAATFAALYREITGAEVRLLRPPYGNGIRKSIVRNNVGLPMIHWSVDTLDWKYKDANSVLARALEGVEDGAIILMHDIHPTTVDAVPGIIDNLRAAGYEMVTIPELAEIRGVGLVAGETYFSFKP